MVVGKTVLLEGTEDTPQQITIGAYPNPFNPTTRIRFSLPTEQAVQLNVYDVTGRLVSVLVSDVRTAGEHTVVFRHSSILWGVMDRSCILWYGLQTITQPVSAGRIA